jgi:hypothetical protein
MHLYARWGHWIFFSIYLIIPAHYGAGVDSPNWNEYQESSWEAKALPAGKADDLTAIFEAIV